jgi:hypothetical protein
MKAHDDSSGKFRWGLIGFGICGLLVGASALVLTLVAIGILVVPFIVWFAWNGLDFAAAIGAPELGFWGIVLLTLFLTTGLGGRIFITLLVWLFDPSWFAGSGELHWPQPSIRTLIALFLLLVIAQMPAHTRHDSRRVDRQPRGVDASEADRTGRGPRSAAPV